MTYPGQGWAGQPQPDNQGQPNQGLPNQGAPDQGMPQGPPTAGWPPQQQYQQPQYPGQQPYPQQGQQFPPPPYQQGPPYPGQPFNQPFNQAQPPYQTTQYPIGMPSGQQPQKKRRSGLVVGVIVAVVVLAAGGVGTWFAFNHAGSSTGSASPEQAATKLLADVSNDDVLGIVNDLPPAEAALLSDSIQASTNQLKRLQVIKSNVDPHAVSGLNIHTSGITFASQVEKVNPHLAINMLIAGKITVGGGLTENNFTDTFLHSAFPNGMPGGQTNTVDIASVVRQLGHPIRIATVEVNGTWYPSLFYSIADAGLQAAHKNWPAQSIPAVGAASADDAVRNFVQAALDSDVTAVIERTAPDEMGALHDAGQVLVNAAGNGQPSGVKIDSVTFADRNVAGGVDTVLRSMTLSENGDRIVLTQSGGCYSMQQASTGQNQRFCASDLANQVQKTTALLPPELVKMIQDMFTGLMNQGVGIVATQVGGQWYVSPGRTITQLALDLYSAITPQDLAALVQLGQHH